MSTIFMVKYGALPIALVLGMKRLVTLATFILVCNYHNIFFQGGIVYEY
jgi:hypothetical protein